MNIDIFHHLETVRSIMASLPGAEEYVCFGTPAFRVKKKLLARLKEDGETLVVHTDDRDVWIETDPNVFFVTDHYRNYPLVLVKLAVVKREILRQLLLEGLRQIAPKRLLKDL